MRYAGPIPVSELARTARLELRTFGFRFLTATGFTPSEYLRQLRITNACQRLELSQSSIETIARDMRYMDVSAFRRMFHEVVDLSPGDYRKRFSFLKDASHLRK